MLAAVLCVCNYEVAGPVRIADNSVIDSSAVLGGADRIDCQEIRKTDCQVIKVPGHPLICVEYTGFGLDDFLAVFRHLTQILGHVPCRYIRHFLRRCHIGKRCLNIRIVQSFCRADRLLGLGFICRLAVNFGCALGEGAVSPAHDRS